MFGHILQGQPVRLPFIHMGNPFSSSVSLFSHPSA